MGGNSKTSLIINISPELNDIEETLASLSFGQRACKISNKIFINNHKSQKEINTDLKEELAAKDLLINELEYEKV